MTKIHLAVLAALLAGCATQNPVPKSVELPVSPVRQAEAQATAAQPQQKTLKRKLAIGRFTNETRYGRTFVTDDNLDPIGKQASDMLANRLVASNRFLVFERQDLNRIKAEQAILQQADLVGVDTLILGSVTEFGRSTTGKSGFLSATKIQTARAKVEIRLVDARTGHVFFSANGAGEASTESGQVAGFGSKADYDGSLNDRAIGAALSDVQTALMNKLDARPWRTDILKVSGRQLYISGGERQGLRVGGMLDVMHEGEKVKSGQTGFRIALPGTQVARVRVVQLFGDNDSNEGAVVELVSGSLGKARTSDLYIAESRH
ncbi:CsgG/HfaB family protein [Microvirgula aerodenitrificans]|uniref:CsgG/HfaB family protein n=1 Tax=Microvirgula aerodenitrificans TaxID=57480 RepID=UPI00248DA877|nr:CsgG/HfaB family protein [Microvirgula aerodenitrificans]